MLSRPPPFGVAGFSFVLASGGMAKKKDSPWKIAVAVLLVETGGRPAQVP